VKRSSHSGPIVAEHLVAGLRCSEVRDLVPGFVLGALEPAEADTVRRHLADCPEAHAEVVEFGAVVPALLETVELVAPPQGLRGRILAAAAAEGQAAIETRAERGPVPAATRPAELERTPVRPAPVRPAPVAAERRGGWTDLFRRPVWAAAALAAVVAALALGIWNIQLRDEIAGLAAYRNGVVEVLDKAAEAGAQLAVLRSPEGAEGPSGLAAVGSDGGVALVMRDLAPTTGTQVYETWLIGSDGAPVPVGSFTVDASGTGSFATTQPNVGPGVTVALTRESGPGATTPTEPIIAAGEAQAQAS
jgi:anti-sigma factor RsiW